MRWDKELPQCIRKLRNQHVHYAQTIRILLEPMSSAEELAEMMMHPGESTLWKNKDMASRLQDRLQESYHAYQGTIADIERITKQIASKLDLDRANEVRRDEPACNAEENIIFSGHTLNMWRTLVHLGRSMLSSLHCTHIPTAKAK